MTNLNIPRHEHRTAMPNDENLGQASVPAVNQYLDLARELQLDLAKIFEEAHINPAALSDSSNHISGINFQQLILTLINYSKDELYGLHTAKFVQPGSYSVLGFISMNCETLGQAMTKIQPFEKLVGDMGTTTIEDLNEQVKIGWHCQFNHPIVKRHMIDNCLASWVTFARYLISQPCNPSEILLTRKEPPLDQQNDYHNLFRCPIKYGQKENAIVFDKTLLAMPLNKGNQQILSTLESHAKTLISNLSHEDTFLALLRLAIENALQHGNTSQQQIAQKFGISAKTLQRRLADVGLQYQTFLDDIRLEKAKHYLSETTLTLNVVSVQLGFKEPRSFYRWFNKVIGETPGKYRGEIMKEKLSNANHS
ncbi:MAG: AraC family transcriptional regulator ligand-binding domain-containing protein [Thalassotalea sp.]|nr:AraC family transcriptional regulator ligand-binding domain-containing protein [Thalassotalea sp.]